MSCGSVRQRRDGGRARGRGLERERERERERGDQEREKEIIEMTVGLCFL